MHNDEPAIPPRYQRQELFTALGRAGQRRLLEASVLIVGVGGLGSWLAEILVRAGVGRLRLVDDDVVDWTNIARQAMYDERDAMDETPKIQAAAQRLATINRHTRIEPIRDRVTAETVANFADGMDLILDGTDDWRSRFLLNDFAVRDNRPWIHAGVVQAQGQVLTVVPGRSGCLRCLYESPPAIEKELANRANRIGVLGAAVAAVAAVEAVEAVKLLSGNAAAVRPGLLKLDLWTNQVQQISLPRATDCVCCGRREFEYLNAEQPTPSD
jgi:adenylyltransferase/sulfurtransferase